MQGSTEEKLTPDQSDNMSKSKKHHRVCKHWGATAVCPNTLLFFSNHLSISYQLLILVDCLKFIHMNLQSIFILRFISYSLPKKFYLPGTKHVNRIIKASSASTPLQMKRPRARWPQLLTPASCPSFRWPPTPVWPSRKSEPYHCVPALRNCTGSILRT